MTASSDQQRLEQLLHAKHPCISIVTHEESHALELVKAAAMNAVKPLWTWSAVQGLRPAIFDDSKPLPETEHPAAALFQMTQMVQDESVCVMLDLAGMLDDARTLRALRETINTLYETGGTLVLIDHQETLPEAIRAVTTPLELSLPGEGELKRIVQNAVRRLNKQRKVDVKVSRSDLQTILRNLRGLTRRQAEQIILDVVADDWILDIHDINTILAHKRQRLHSDGVLEFIEAPVAMNEIGGLNRLKTWLKHRRLAMNDEAEAFGLTAPRGVLLLGVQGAGKSFSAKAIATAWQRPLLRLDPGTLYDKYIGESEGRLRQALQQAETMAPIVLWIDEIEKGFAAAASRSTDGGLSQRMFGTLLTWMQEHTAPVFLVATANDIEALPPELLRKGRFDEIFFVDLPGKAARRQIFTIHLKNRGREPKDFDLQELADVSDGFSGAEIEQAIISALHEAFSGKKKLNTALIADAIRNSPPLSVTMAERIEGLRRWAQGRCVPAD